MNRRNFAGYLLKGAATLGLLSTMTIDAACSFGTVFADILKYVGVGLTSFQSVVDLLAGAGIIPIGTGAAIDTIIALIKAGFADLQTEVTAYNNAPAADKTTLEGKISVILANLQTSLQNFWSQLTIPDANLASTVEGLIGVILSTLAGFATQLPAAPATLTAKLAGKTISYTAKKRTVHQFKNDFNAVLVAHGYKTVKF
jgi:hypothetical protein